MSVIQGTSGMQMGDGASGKIALDIERRVLGLLYESSFTFRVATVRDKGQLKTGSVSYQLPEILKTTAYGDGTTGFQIPQSGLIEIPINIRRTVKYTYETFDASRLGVWEDSVLGMISSSIALSIENDLNGQFWMFLINQFELTKGTLRKQNLTIPALSIDMSNPVAPSLEDIKAAMFLIQAKAIELNKLYNKRTLRVPKEQMMLFFDPMVDIVFRQAFWNQPNSLGERVVAKDLVGREFGAGLTYFTDAMLNNNIPKNTSFAEDYDINTTGFLGFIIHNEAIAMPFNLNQMTMVTDQENGNPRFIAKYQFGLGLLRNNLIYSITKTAPTA